MPTDVAKLSPSPLALVYEGEPMDLHLLPCEENGTWVYQGTRYTIFRVWEPILRANGWSRRARYILRHPAGDWIGPIPTPAGEYELRQVARDLEACRRTHGRA